MAEKREDYKDVLGEAQFECICEECSKPFIGIDEDATLCPDCWDKILEKIVEENGLELENK